MPPRAAPSRCGRRANLHFYNAPEPCKPAVAGMAAKEVMIVRPASLLIAAAAAVALPAAASPELAQKKNCLACHTVDKKIVGPAYKDIAAKYAGQKDAADRLADKIMKGGVGAWGQVPMPANPGVSAAEAKQLASWILSLK